MNYYQQKRDEHLQDFQIDQNEQNINRLRKKTKELSDGFDALSQSASISQTDIASLKTDVASAQADIAELKSSSTTTEEKIELGSYDCFKTKERIYTDIFWKPRPVAFVAESGKSFKFRVKFDAVSSFDKTITSTAKITFDESDVFSDTKDIEAGGTHSVDFEYISSSEKTGHKIVVELTNTETSSKTTACCIPRMMTIELWGTNVQFISRNCDFTMVPAGQNIVMTTNVFENDNIMFSMQTADDNFSFEESSFNYLKSSNYHDYNLAKPAINSYVDEETNTIVYSDKPSIYIHNVKDEKTDPRVVFYLDIEKTNITSTSPKGAIVNAKWFASFLYGKSGNIANGHKIPDFFSFTYEGEPFLLNRGMFYTTVFRGIKFADMADNFDGCGVLRVDNIEDKTTFYGIITRTNGTSYFWAAHAVPNPLPTQKIELGFGTHANAYLIQNNQIVIFLRVGKNIKKITLEPADNGVYYNFVSSEIIENVQEYWLAPNGYHFERAGNKIKYISPNEETASKTLEVY